MNAEEFVSALKIVACDNAAKGVLQVIRNPPGRNPDQRLVELSQWLKAAPPGTEAFLNEALLEASRQAVYNVLLVLDGRVCVSDKDVKLQLIECSGAEPLLLNDVDTEYLSDIYKALP